MRRLVFFLPALVVVGGVIYVTGAWREFKWPWAVPPQVQVYQAAAAVLPQDANPAIKQPAVLMDPNEARLEEGRQLAKSGNRGGAQQVFAELMRRFPASPIGSRAAVEMGLLYKEAGDAFNERNALSQAVTGALDEALRRQVVVELHRLNGELVFSKKPAPDSLTYVVKKGDSLHKIAQQYKITPQFIKRVNYLSSDRINVGDKLKVFEGPFDIVVEKGKFRLTVYRAGVFVKEYPVGIGKNGSTPEGEFYVTVKLVDPAWDPPGPEYAASKAADNPLGTRWIGFDGEYGVHGTIDPQSIGKAESRGCVRCLNENVEEVYDMVIMGSKVTVRP